MPSQISEATDVTATEQEEQRDSMGQADQLAAMIEANYDYKRLERSEIREATIVLIE